jgi:hypothetical protein
MVKRIAVKKEPKMKQKQKQQQNVVVNIGSIAKPRKPRQTKPKQPKPDNKPKAQIIQGVLTRGPNTFYQQPQPPLIPPQPPQSQTQNINEIFRLIQQQQRTNIPDAPQVGGNLINQTPISIAPPPVVEAPIKAENDLERIRKARIGKFEKPALQKAFEKEPLGQENAVFQGLAPAANLTAVFRLAERNETNPSLLGEVRAEPNIFTDPINVHPPERIATKEAVKPSLTLEPSSLTETPSKRRQGAFPNYKSALSTLTGEFKEESALFGELLASKKVGTLRALTSELAAKERELALPPVKTTKKPFFVEEKDPLSLLETIEQSGENTEPEILQGGEVPAEEIGGSSVGTPDEPPEEEVNTITEIKVGEKKQEEEPVLVPAYQGGEFLPAIIQPPEAASTIEQLLVPRVEPSLVAAAAAEEVRPADAYRTEQLVKGQPEPEIPQGTPKFRLFMLAQSLGANLSTTGSKKLNTDEIKERIVDKMGEGYVIPDFKAEAKKPGPKPKGKATKEAEVVIEP